MKRIKIKILILGLIILDQIKLISGIMCLDFFRISNRADIYLSMAFDRLVLKNYIPTSIFFKTIAGVSIKS